ncbi:MAG: protein kinase [Thermoleophilia bacterium]
MGIPAGTAADHTVLGRYVMGAAIGRGATSVVHRAHDLHTGEGVAVKAVPVELGLAERVRAEVRAAGRLDHPRVVRLRDWGEDRDHLYLVWDLVEGPSLSQLLRGPEPPRDGASLRIGEDLLRALAHAHERGVVHRDVKPANVLIDGDGHARLSDFGVARLSGEAGLTMTGDVVGTIAYMAPEQAVGDEAGPAADVYAACLVLYECLTGTNPNAGATPAETARRAASGAVPPLARERADLAPGLTHAIDAGLHRDPRRRPGAAELADAVGGARGGVRAARRRGLRAVPPVASGAAGAALAAVALTLAEPPARLARDGGWAPAVAVAVIAAAAALFAWRTRAGMLLAVIGGAALVGTTAPAAGALIGAGALAVLLLGWRHGRLVLLPLAAPALFAVGLGPLFPALAGLVPRWPARLWVAGAGAVAAVAWQVARGGDLLAGAGYVEPAVSALRDERSPADAAEGLWRPLADMPQAGVQALILVVAAMCVPLVVRRRPDGPREAAALVWTAALAVALVAAAPDPADALGAVIPATIVLVAAAFRPWRALAERGSRKASATLRGPDR